jgi:hypothetical protein
VVFGEGEPLLPVGVVPAGAVMFTCTWAVGVMIVPACGALLSPPGGWIRSQSANAAPTSMTNREPR